MKALEVIHRSRLGKNQNLATYLLKSLKSNMNVWEVTKKVMDKLTLSTLSSTKLIKAFPTMKEEENLNSLEGILLQK